MFEKKIVFDYKKILVLFCIILFSLNVFAIFSSGEIKIFAVTEKDEGMIADLYLNTFPGTGDISFTTSSSLVGKDTQLTGNIALEIAQKESNVLSNSKDFIFKIKANASEVDGPSAGAAMTLLAYSVLFEKPLNKEIGITGTINSDGSIGVVGGIGAKAKIASENGIKLLMIPSGQSITYIKDDSGVNKSVNLLAYGPEKLGLKVVEVSTIKDVLKYAYSDIDDIVVDYIEGTSSFIPQAIKYKSQLLPMVDISKNYISRAKKSIDIAEKELEISKLDDGIRAVFYTQLGRAKRDVELSQIYLDQNYLYSAANYSFNAQVVSEVITLISINPSLLLSESKILDLKVTDLRNEIYLFKKEMDFISINDIEWLIGAQQRIAYAENALNNIYLEQDLGEDFDEQTVQYSKVHEFVSAQQWVIVARDFFKKSKSDSKLVVPNYSQDFILKVNAKIDTVEKLISDANLSISNSLEAMRRLNSAKISFENEFYFAALYDAFFAESFFSSEVKRADINDLEKEINAISENVNFNSLWANLFFDHSGFYAKNAVFERELNRTNASDSLMITSFDLLILSKKIEDARFEVINYLNNTKFDGYVSEDIVDSGLGSKIEITYVQKPNVGIYISLLLLCVLILLLVFVVIGVKSSRNRGLRSISRAEKIDFLLNRLDKALSQKKISDAEYFFLKKNYDSEYSALKDFREERSIITLNLDESKSKLNALQKGLKDLKKHYSAGLIIPEDYAKNLADVNLQIIDIKNQIRIFEEKLYASRRNNFSRRFPKNNSNFDKKKDSNLGKKNDSEFNVKGTSSKTNKLSYSEFDVLGTGEKEKDEKLIEEKEKIARRKLLKKFKKNKKV